VSIVEEIRENTTDVAMKIQALRGMDSFQLGFGGSHWVWDPRSPQAGGLWHLFRSSAPFDPELASYLDPERVDQVRIQAECLADAFLGTERRLRELGCEHTGLLHTPIRSVEGIAAWGYSVWNAAFPFPSAHAEVCPSAVWGTVSLMPTNFMCVQPDREGLVVVLPAENGQTRIYWASSGSSYESRRDPLLGARHPVSIAAWKSVQISTSDQEMSHA